MVESRADADTATSPPCGSAVDAWPESPVAGNARLVPITS